MASADAAPLAEPSSHHAAEGCSLGKSAAVDNDALFAALLFTAAGKDLRKRSRRALPVEGEQGIPQGLRAP